MAKTVDLEQIKREFDRDGFVIVRGYFDSKQVRELLDQIERYMQMLPQLPPEAAFYEDKSDPDSLKRLDQMSKDQYFRDLLDHAPWVSLVEHLLGQPIDPRGISLFSNPPRVGQPTPPHQDGYYYMIEPNESAMTWLSLDEADEGNGCVRYVSGSHRRGLREHSVSNVFGFSLGLVDYGPADAEQEVPACMQPGDLIVHHCLVIHRADANRSTRRRWGLGSEYRSKRAKEDVARRQAHNRMMKRAWSEKGKL